MFKFIKTLDIKLVNWIKKFLAHTENWSPIRKKVIGALLFIFGIILIFTPGPGFVFISAGGALMSKKFGIFIASLIQKYLKWRGIDSNNLP